MELAVGQLWHIKNYNGTSTWAAYIEQTGPFLIYRYVNEEGNLGAKMTMSTHEFQKRIVVGPFVPVHKL